jgi:hypothetical protein
MEVSKTPSCSAILVKNQLCLSARRVVWDVTFGTSTHSSRLSKGPTHPLQSGSSNRDLVSWYCH